jgi:hypothetical protein
LKAENENIEEFEDLIRNSSSHEEYSIQDGDWEQLQMMMNASDRRKNMGWIWRDTIVFLLLGAWLLLGTNYSSINIEEEEALASGTEATASAAKNDPTKESFQATTQTKRQTSDTEAGASAKENDISEASSANMGVEASIKKNDITESPASRTKAGASSKENFKAAKKEMFPASDPETGTLDKKNTLAEESSASNTELGGLGKKNDLGQETPTLAIETEASDAKDDLPKVTPPPIIIETEPETIAENTNPEPLPIDSTTSNPTVEKALNRKLHFYLGVGADWSIASPMPVGPTKLKLQIGGEYQFLKKWSVLSGLNYTVKAYETNSEDYAVTPGFWAGGIKPTSILAECNVLEIPLNIRYYFNAQDRRRSSFYLTAGASSYLMASERYRFTYDVNDPTLKQEWDGKWKNMHYFGVLHLSAGYQKSFEKNWSVLVEPYFDLPLTGIGFGQVNLMSFGVSLCVKY